ncbi:MAG TPA: exosortase A [Casimicrobiaceae bacterium]|nr:exosortase A [Casimicrobiaceae bacterium]
MASILEPSGASAAVGHRAQPHVPVAVAAIAAAGILLLHLETVRSIVAIWLRSETFAHGFAVVPIALWLAWRERHMLATIPARPYGPALLGVAAAALMWLAASLADVQAPRQFALVFMVQAAIVATLGLRLARAALLPLAFLLFAVPAGEFLLPVLIDWTANFTVAALQVTGVPVFREANHFVIPSGAWSVVEACSGLRYLIASVMIGVVFAEVSYRSAWRKVAFIGASILVPLVANWLRAYLIVMIGHLSNNRLAVGVDHLIYGWVFFGIVMALLFWFGSLWAEKPAGNDRGGPRPVVAAAPQGSVFAFGALGVAAIVLSAAALVIDHRLERSDEAATPRLGAVVVPAGFQASGTQPAQWQPGFRNEGAKLRQGFLRNGVPVGLHVSAYVNQAKGRELVTSTNQLVHPNDFAWRELERRSTAVRFGDREASATRSLLSGERGRFVVVWTYWIDGHVTANPVVAKAWLAWTRARGRPDLAALVAVFVPEREGGDAATDAMQALLPVTDAALRASGGSP